MSVRRLWGSRSGSDVGWLHRSPSRGAALGAPGLGTQGRAWPRAQAEAGEGGWGVSVSQPRSPGSLARDAAVRLQLGDAAESRCGAVPGRRRRGWGAWTAVSSARSSPRPRVPRTREERRAVDGNGPGAGRTPRGGRGWRGRSEEGRVAGCGPSSIKGKPHFPSH